MIRARLIYLNEDDTTEEVYRDIPTSWEEVTLGQAAEFFEVVKNYEDHKKAVADLSEESTPDHLSSSAEDMHKELTFQADMIKAITGLERQIVYAMSVPNFNRLCEMCSWISDMDSFTNEVIDHFYFRTATNEQISKMAAEIRKTKSGKHKDKIIKRLKECQDVRFNLYPNVDNMTLGKWISSQQAVKDIEAIRKQVTGGAYHLYPRLLSYIVYTNDNHIKEKKRRKLEEAFKELPFITAYKAANFFLAGQVILSQKIQTYMMSRTKSKMVAQKQKVNSDWQKFMDGSSQ